MPFITSTISVKCWEKISDEKKTHYLFLFFSYLSLFCLSYQIRWDEETEEIIVDFFFERNLINFAMTVAIPTIIANLIGHTTNFFGDDHFDAAIGVNLTILLVITTM